MPFSSFRSNSVCSPPHSSTVNKHFYYTYSNGWVYEAWFKSHDRVVYAIHSGQDVVCPLDGRKNFQTIYPQRIRKNLWQVSWVRPRLPALTGSPPFLTFLRSEQMEETASQVTICIDIDEKRITSFIALSYGHFHQADKAKGWKREQMEQWKELAKIHPEPEARVLMPEHAEIQKVRPSCLPFVNRTLMLPSFSFAFSPIPCVHLPSSLSIADFPPSLFFPLLDHRGA